MKVILIAVAMAIATSAFASGPSLMDGLTKDEKVVMLTLLAEAGGEGSNGMYAVACVIQERTIRRHLTAANVCLQHSKNSKYWQFSCWNGKTVEVLERTPMVVSMPSSVLQRARSIAQKVVAKTPLDRSLVHFAGSYCTLATENYWTKGQTVLVVINHHKFYKL